MPPDVVHDPPVSAVCVAPPADTLCLEEKVMHAKDESDNLCRDRQTLCMDFMSTMQRSAVVSNPL